MKRILLISLAALAMFFVSCSGDTPSGVSMNIPAQFHGEWTGALEKVVISAHDIEITSSCVGEGVYRLSDYASLDSIVIDQSHDGYKFTASYSDNLSNNNATQITVSISGTKDKISLEMEGNDDRKPYIGSIFLVPVSDTISNQTLSVPSFLHGNFTGSQEDFTATISNDNISIKTYGYMEPNENDEWQIAILDFNAHKDDLKIIYQNSQEDGVYEIFFSLTESGRDFRFAWRFEEKRDGFQLRFSCINDFGYSHGGDVFTKTDN